MVAYSKIGNLRGGLWAGSAVADSSRNFTANFPAGRFVVAPIVTLTMLSSSAGAAAYKLTNVTASACAGSILSVASGLGLSGVIVQIHAVAAG